jgi:hypothetical protein
MSEAHALAGERGLADASDDDIVDVKRGETAETTMVVPLTSPCVSVA